jgi:hypothetical protein
MGRVGLRAASWVLGCPLQPIASQWLQAAGRQGAGIVSRPSGSVREQTHHHRGLPTEGIWSRRAL